MIASLSANPRNQLRDNQARSLARLLSVDGGAVALQPPGHRKPMPGTTQGTARSSAHPRCDRIKPLWIPGRIKWSPATSRAAQVCVATVATVPNAGWTAPLKLATRRVLLPQALRIDVPAHTSRGEPVTLVRRRHIAH